MLRRNSNSLAISRILPWGELYIPSRTIGDAEVVFRSERRQPPLHYDMEYAKERGFPSILVHPLQMLLYTTPGASDFSYLIEDTPYLCRPVLAFCEARVQGRYALPRADRERSRAGARRGAGHPGHGP